MSSRLTTPVSKLTRCFSTTPAAARPTHLISNATKTASTTRKGRKPNALAEDSVVETDQHRSHSTSTPHRPTIIPRSSTPNPKKPVPFMQTFHHSAPKPTPAPLATIDRAVLPDLSSWDSSNAYDPYAHIRVPLLPDSTAASSSWAGRQPEAADAPLATQPEILVVAANPELVLPSALTEVGGMGVDGVELGFVHLLGNGYQGEGGGREGAEESFELGRGMIRDLWKGLVDDVWGAQGGAKGGAGGGPAAAV